MKMILSEKLIVKPYGTSKHKIEVKYTTLEKLDTKKFDSKSGYFKTSSTYEVNQSKDFVNIYNIVRLSGSESKKYIEDTLSKYNIEYEVKKRISSLNIKNRNKKTLFSSTNLAEAQKIFKFYLK
jgi:hypothetical protein